MRESLLKEELGEIKAPFQSLLLESECFGDRVDINIYIWEENCSYFGSNMTSNDHKSPSSFLNHTSVPLPDQGTDEAVSAEAIFHSSPEQPEISAQNSSTSRRRFPNRLIMKLCACCLHPSRSYAEVSQPFHKNKAFQIRLSHFGIQQTLRFTKTRLVVRAKPLDGTRAAVWLPKQVVLKVIPYDKDRSKNGAKISREAECQKALHHHPNIATLLTTIEKFRKTVLVTAFSPGGDLLNNMERFPRGMPELMAVGIITQILDAVAYMHERGYAHRDIKLENIVIQDSDDLLACEIPTVKLIDFGLCFQWDLSRPRSCVCMDRPFTEGYTPPEVFMRQSYCPKAVDIFCIGGVLYRILCSREPSLTGTVVTAFHKMGQDSAMFDTVLFDDVSRATRQFVRKCMSMDPKDRPNARTALCALEKITEDLQA